MTEAQCEQMKLRLDLMISWLRDLGYIPGGMDPEVEEPYAQGVALGLLQRAHDSGVIKPPWNRKVFPPPVDIKAEAQTDAAPGDE